MHEKIKKVVNFDLLKAGINEIASIGKKLVKGFSEYTFYGMQMRLPQRRRSGISKEKAMRISKSK